MTGMGDKYTELANAIILQAVDDYRTSRRVLMQPYSPKSDKAVKRRERAKHMISDVKNFFYGQWFQALSEVDGPQIYIRLKREMDAEESKKGRRMRLSGIAMSEFKTGISFAEQKEAQGEVSDE